MLRDLGVLAVALAYTALEEMGDIPFVPTETLALVRRIMQLAEGEYGRGFFFSGSTGETIDTGAAARVERLREMAAAGEVRLPARCVPIPPEGTVERFVPKDSAVQNSIKVNVNDDRGSKQGICYRDVQADCLG